METTVIYNCLFVVSILIPLFRQSPPGDFIKNDEPQGNQVFCQMNECIPEVVKAMRAAIKETGSSKLFSANITADDLAHHWSCFMF
jgi:hypothetical protein